MKKLILAAASALALSPLSVPAQLRVASGGDVLVTRLCEVYSRGDVYCRGVDQLLQNEWRNIDPAVLQASFKKVYENRGLDQRHNGLISCGSQTFAAAPQSHGANPTSGDINAARNSCLRELEKRMNSIGTGRGRGRAGVFGGAPWQPGSGGGSTWTGTTCASGDPTRGQASGRSSDLSDLVEPLVPESEIERQRRDYYLKDEEKWRDAASKETDEGERRLMLSMADEASRFAHEAELKRRAAEREEARRREAEASGGGGSEGRAGSGTSTCQEVDNRIRQTLDECNRKNWDTYSCKKLLGCPNPGVINPIPNETGTRGSDDARGNERRPGLSCGNVEIFGEDDLRRAVQEYCDERARYGPDGGGRCASFDSNGRMPSMVDAACGTRALTENGCPFSVDASAVLPSFRRNFQSEILNAHSKLGGPLVVLPVRNPTGPRGPVGPRPGSSSQTPTIGRPTP